MKIHKSGSRLSAIVKIAQDLKKLSKDTGREYLPLNRGINSVCPIDLTETVKGIDFNSTGIQNYPPSTGRADLKEAITTAYFQGKANPENIIITGGSTVGLDISFQVLDMDIIYIPAFYWTTYDQIMRIRLKDSAVYQNYDQLKRNLPALKNCGVIICDPGNPLGDKYDDQKLLELIKTLAANGTYVLLDSPYRRMFYDESDTFYRELAQMENVVIIESFSKCVGLSGQRIGFVYCKNSDFIREFSVRLVSATNGINAFSQVLVQKLLAAPEGIKAVKEFKSKTLRDIGLNIEYLQEKNLLAERFYEKSKPVGIFVAAALTQEELLSHFIGSVSLSYFTRVDKKEAGKFVRLCVSVPHDKFVEFFSNMLKNRPRGTGNL